MIKTIIKESVILILFCMAILLTITVLFYNYIPSNKIVPSKISYETPEEITNEIKAMENRADSETIIEQTIGVMTGDMQVYEQSKSYKPGKVDPFSSEKNVVSDKDSKKESKTEQTNTVKSSSNTSKGTFYNDTGTK